MLQRYEIEYRGDTLAIFAARRKNFLRSPYTYNITEEERAKVTTVKFSFLPLDKEMFEKIRTLSYDSNVKELVLHNVKISNDICGLAEEFMKSKQIKITVAVDKIEILDNYALKKLQNVSLSIQSNGDGSFLCYEKILNIVMRQGVNLVRIEFDLEIVQPKTFEKIIKFLTSMGIDKLEVGIDRIDLLTVGQAVMLSRISHLTCDQLDLDEVNLVIACILTTLHPEAIDASGNSLSNFTANKKIVLSQIEKRFARLPFLSTEELFLRGIFHDFFDDTDLDELIDLHLY